MAATRGKTAILLAVLLILLIPGLSFGNPSIPSSGISARLSDSARIIERSCADIPTGHGVQRRIEDGNGASEWTKCLVDTCNPGYCASSNAPVALGDETNTASGPQADRADFPEPDIHRGFEDEFEPIPERPSCSSNGCFQPGYDDFHYRNLCIANNISDEELPNMVLLGASDQYARNGQYSLRAFLKANIPPGDPCTDGDGDDVCDDDDNCP